MKRLFLLPLVMFALLSCTKESDIHEEKTASSSNQNTEQLQPSFMQSDPLVESLTNLNTYLEGRNAETGGDFFDYLVDYPDYTFQELDSLGFIDLSYLEQELEIVEEHVTSRDIEDVMAIVETIVDPIFIGYSPDTPSARICLFCCYGCFTPSPADNCYRVLFWKWGPGCDPLPDF